MKKESLNSVYASPNSNSLYVMHYPKGKNIVVSYGILSQIEDKYINHKCNTDKGSFGSPIMSLSTLKVIGMHSKGARKTFRL